MFQRSRNNKNIPSRVQIQYNDKLSKLLVPTIDRTTERCSARTMMDKKQAFVKYRDKLTMKFRKVVIVLVKVPVNAPMKRVTSTSARQNQFYFEVRVTRTDVDQRKWDISISCLAGILAFVLLTPQKTPAM